MKSLVGTELGAYSFSAATRKITFSGLPMNYSLGIQQILLITNVATNVIIYNFASPPLGGTMSNNVLTLDFDTSSMSDTDALQIYIDIESVNESLHAMLRRVIKLLESNAVVDGSTRQRVAVEVMPTVAVTMAGGMGAASAVTIAAGQGPLGAANTQFPTPANPLTVASQNVQYISEGPVDQRWRIIDAARASYAAGIRSNLTFS